MARAPKHGAKAPLPAVERSVDDYDREFRETGYLAPASEELIPAIRSLSADWFELANKANRVFQGITMRSLETVKGTSLDPKVVAAFLMIRSSSLVQGAILMAERGMAVEARMLIRSLLENALCLGALHEKPVQFLAMLKADADASKRAQASFILANEMARPGSVEEAKLTELIAKLEKGTKNLPIKSVAELSPLKRLYLTYRVLSNDSGHASAKSLGRYMNTLPDRSGWAGYIVGPASDKAIDDCLLVLLQALTAAGVAFTQLVGDMEGNQEIADLSDAMRDLSQRAS